MPPLNFGSEEAMRFVMLLLLSTVSAVAEPIRADQIKAKDGDTVWIGGEEVRLLGFDTPETAEGLYRCDAEKARGEREVSSSSRKIHAGGRGSLSSKCSLETTSFARHHGSAPRLTEL
jgi:endonuclease YncB( thermonuclease family)